MRALCAASLSLALVVGFVACGGGTTDPGSADAQVRFDGCACSAPDASTSEPDASVVPADATTAAGAGADAATQPALDAAAQPKPDAAAQPGLDAAIAGLDAYTPIDYDAGPSSGTPCSFNTDCPANERCDEFAGFVCTAGPRGTGKTGVDRCNNSNECEQAVCLEGWPEGTLYCSGPCGADAGNCTGILPICSKVAFIGEICIRDPNGG